MVRRCVDGNVWRPITELRVGAASMRSAELQPVVTTLRFARWRRQLHVEYVENELGVGATGRQETVAVGVGRVQRRVIHRAHVADARLSRRSAPRPSASVQTADVDALLVVCSKTMHICIRHEVSGSSGVNGYRILAGTRWPIRKYATDAH